MRRPSVVRGPAPEWWRTYFDDVFLSVYRPLLPREEAEAEVDAIVEILGTRRGRVLDVACGWGRHALPLARAGHRVTGLDLSLPLLTRARRLAAEEEIPIDWVRGDMRQLPFRAAFDTVLSLFSSLGYFGSDEEDVSVLRGVHHALRPDGRFILETMHRDQVAREYAERDWWEGERGERVWVEREFDVVRGVSREWLRWEGGGSSGERYHEVRIRSATEWDRLLREAGLEPVVWYGDWDLSPLAHTSERLIVLARPLG